MTKEKAPPEIGKLLLQMLLKGTVVPLLVLALFLAAPHWLNSRIRREIDNSIDRDPGATVTQKATAHERNAKIDYEQVALRPPPGFEKLHEGLRQAGTVATYQRLRWGLWGSIFLVVLTTTAALGVRQLIVRAGRSSQDLISSYQLGWKISIAVALLNVVLLVPLLAYGTFEAPVILTGSYFPKLLLVIIIGGLYALVQSGKILLKDVPMEFKEPMAREVTPMEAPELWQIVRDAAARLNTAPPDHILVGQQINFYVTELAVRHDTGQAGGRVLFLSLPLLKELSVDQTIAIIGHELGHFVGEDTRLTREFYPLRWKIHATLVALGRSGWVGRSSFYLLQSFHLAFARTEQTASRTRELLADQKGVFLTSAQTCAKALVRFSVLAEAFNRHLREAMKKQIPNPLAVSLQPIIRDQLAGEENFWPQLFEKKLPHPLDSHPPLHIRLEALGQNISPPDARAIALEETPSAYEAWFANKGELFTGIQSKAEAAVAKMQTQAKIKEADYQSDEGKKLLDQHFPVVAWSRRQDSFWLMLFGLAIFIVGAAAGVIFLQDVGLRVFLGVLTLLLLAGAAGVWIRIRHASLTLSAEGLSHSAWVRPLRFKDVAKVTARSSYGNISIRFHLTQKQPPFWKMSVPLPRRNLQLSLGGYGQKPKQMVDSIFRYYLRKAPAVETEA